MKWLHFLELPINYSRRGNLRKSEPWVSAAETLSDTGRQKSIKDLSMTMSVVDGADGQPDELLYLHFTGQPADHGICIAYISENEEE